MKHHETCKLKNQKIIAEITSAMGRVGHDADALGFAPWKGRDYGSSKIFGKKRVLILGESHYEWCKKCWNEDVHRSNDLTCWSIAEAAHNVTVTPHFKKIEYALTGESMDSLVQKREAFWHSIAYSNYVQRTVGYYEGGERAPRPTQEMWKEANKAFPKLMEILKPDFVVVLGFGLWQELPSLDGDRRPPDIEAGGKSLEQYRYDYSGKKILALRVRHPAGGLGSTWYPVLRKAIGLA